MAGASRPLPRCAAAAARTFVAALVTSNAPAIAFISASLFLLYIVGQPITAALSQQAARGA